MCTTSALAYSFAKKLCDEYDRRKEKERNLNVRKEEKPKTDSKKNGDGISRTVTEIDYSKHERTVKELDRQEKEQEYERKKNEASQWCTLDHEHGPNCRRPPTSCSHDHQKEWQIYERSTEEKIQAADRFRQEGNEEYRRNNYGLASVHYRKALLQFDYTFAENEEEEKAVDAVKLPCLLNLAACKCQTEDWDEVLCQCRLALEINPRSVKAYYRSGLAHLARDHFDLAKDSLTSAYEIEPNNKEVLAALRQLKKNMDTYKVRRKDVAKEMLSGNTADEEVAAPEASAPDASAEAKADAEAPVKEPVTQMPTSGEQGSEGVELRQRRPGVDTTDKDEEPDVDDEEEKPDYDAPKYLNCLLALGVSLGVVSLGACAVAFSHL
eukprot:TRINITY_DN20156_c0_g1_i1.p1 TRINITY_DN20156_c0_g1~~TRINITY_DN20156_c0_g1_i1.p1  ORF type:complete len:381 (-),score=97.77 TRINITY_DN20156_c0_g1_i1:7-1149(-)